MSKQEINESNVGFPIKETGESHISTNSGLGALNVADINRLNKNSDKANSESLDFNNNSLFKSVFDKPILVAGSFRLMEGLPDNIRKHFERIGSDVANAFNEPFRKDTKDLDGLQVVGDLTLGGYLGKNTDDPPMYDTAYSAKITRPYEQKLMKDIQFESGPMSLGHLTELAMNVCKNDKYLAILTLANFTKNIASVERGQAPAPEHPTKVYPENTYSKSQSNSLFNRLEKFDDGAKNKLSKVDEAGALYHFYGGILATSAGLGFEIHGENAIFGWSRDPMKREAGSLGSSVAQDVFGQGQQFTDAFKNYIGHQLILFIGD